MDRHPIFRPDPSLADIVDAARAQHVPPPVPDHPPVGWFRFASILLIAMMIGGVAFVGGRTLYPHHEGSPRTVPTQERASSHLSDMEAEKYPAPVSVSTSSLEQSDQAWGAPSNSEPCHLAKVGTFAPNGAGAYAMEVGGGGIQHVDFYPAPGVPAVSYIVPSGQPQIWYGFGSIWEGDGPACTTFDYLGDAIAYAQGRLGDGHSGLVVDLRSGHVSVVANVAHLSPEAINELLTEDGVVRD